MFAITGASVVPCFTKAIIEHYKDRFSMIESLDYAISTSQKPSPGLATYAATFSYVGKPMKSLKNG